VGFKHQTVERAFASSSYSEAVVTKGEIQTQGTSFRELGLEGGIVLGRKYLEGLINPPLEDP